MKKSKIRNQNLKDDFERTLFRTQLILPGDKVFVACSGGPDSVVLFHLLLELKQKWNLRLGLLHFNHGLRGKESARDEKFVRQLAKKHKVPVYVERGEVLKQARQNKESIEEAARKARYDFFLQTAQKYRISKIAFGHTQNDQAETVFMRVLQGTGLQGLLGIREKIHHGKITFVRPLLPFAKKDILSYLKLESIKSCLDSSNRSKRFLRNRIRLEIFPRLEQMNPRLISALARVPAILKEEAEFLGEVENDTWKILFSWRKDSQFSLKKKGFLKLKPALQFRILNRALQELDSKSGLGFEAWQIIKASLARKQFRHSLPKDIDFVLTPSKILVYKKFAKG